MNLLKFFVLVAPSLADVTCSAPEVCNDELADFALAVKKEGPEEPLKLLQIKEATCQQPLAKQKNTFDPFHTWIAF